MEAAAAFAAYFQLEKPGTMILPCPPPTTTKEFEAHPLTNSAYGVGYNGGWHRNDTVRRGSHLADHRYLVTLEYPRHILDDSSKQFQGWFFWNGAWVEIQYAPMRDSCPLIREAFHTDAVVCAHCSMRGPKCLQTIQAPVLRETYEDQSAAEFWLENEVFRFGDVAKELFIEYPEPPGFQKVSHFEVRADPRDIIPRDDIEYTYPKNMMFHSEAIQ
jgi:hypothetical protein